MSALELFMQQSRYQKYQRRQAWAALLRLGAVGLGSMLGAWALAFIVPMLPAVVLSFVVSVSMLCQPAR
jgi:hypothetical protein